MSNKRDAYWNLLLALPTNIEWVVLKLVDETGHIIPDIPLSSNLMDSTSKDLQEKDLLRNRKVARSLVEDGWLTEQDPNEFDFTKAGALAWRHVSYLSSIGEN